MNLQVDKVEKHLAYNIFCGRLNSALRADVPYAHDAELRMRLWQWVGSAQESLLKEVSLLSPLTQSCLHCSVVSAVQTGLLCLKANGQRSAPYGLQLLVGVFSPHHHATAGLKPLKSLRYRHKDGHTMYFTAQSASLQGTTCQCQQSHCHHLSLCSRVKRRLIAEVQSHRLPAQLWR